jgi:ABC-type multidrug transport system ATPase subunit
MTMVSANVTDKNKTIKTDPVQNAPGTNGALLQAMGLTVRARRGDATYPLDISFHIEPGELIALTGPSRSGISVLLQSLAGLLKPASGEILIDGVSLYAQLKAFRPAIGFVPANYALQPNLTVTEVLQDEARLRMPRHVSLSERKQRISSLLETVGLSQATNRRVSSLSKVERRKLSIAVELTSFPKLLLLDESSEPLTPLEELQITTLLRGVSRYQGLTIIQASGHSRSAELSDKIIFLAPGGTLAWFGPDDEAYTYFKGFISGNSSVNFGLDDALEILGNPQLGNGTEWAKRFASHPSYQKYVDDPLNDRYPDLLLQTQPVLRLRNISKEKLPPATIPRANGFRKFMLLVERNARLLVRDKTGLFMLLSPIIIALVDFVLSSPTMSDPKLGDPDRPPIVLGLLVFLVLVTAALVVQNEIFKERAIYQREQRISSLLLPYVLSKIWLVGILAIYEGLVWTIVHFFASTGIGGINIIEALQRLLAYGITFSLVAFIGGILGLVASALSRTPVVITSWVLLFTLPQLFLSGSIIPIAHLSDPLRFLSMLNPSRYAFETLLTTSGYGQAVVSDPCWQLPQDQRISLSDDKKNSCTCMGVNIFSKCNFPGIQAFYSFVIEQPEPDQANYEASVIGMRQYADDLANWQRSRSTIIGSAEEVIAKALDHYGQGFDVNSLSYWSILAGMSLCLMILLIGIQQSMGKVRT